ncbi:hypothetical protein [Duganella aceris]|uniref:PEP-CTERM sorting domain-containing protein n=1 Tax=Duganella aceris TaxID=2703883 RepID=A0ABX0FSQ4_9BURK|nr:hypothetical protein [Duganella aceris]NGZ87716.1 hypothetical protein [Duganella aceris]
MKHLKLLPLLIAAAFCMPRAQAAAVDAAAQLEPSSYGIALICIGLVALAAAGHNRPASFKHDN